MAAIPTSDKPESSRRAFTQLLAMTGIAAAAGGLAVFLRARFQKRYPAVVVAQLGEIPVGGSKIFTYPTDIAPCLLLRPAPDAYVAYSRTCTHAACPVFYSAEENRLNCPCHGGVFSVADGSVLAGPPPHPLPRVILEARGQQIFATGMVKS